MLFVGKKAIFSRSGGLGDTGYSSSAPATFGLDCRVKATDMAVWGLNFTVRENQLDSDILVQANLSAIRADRNAQ